MFFVVQIRFALDKMEGEAAHGSGLPDSKFVILAVFGMPPK